MNLDLLKNSNTINTYKQIIEMNGFHIQNILNQKSATRTTNNTASILDHVITNKNITCTMKLEDHNVSDHKIIYIDIKKIRIKNIKQEIIKTHLDETEWQNRMKEELQKNDVKTFKQLMQLINETKELCTKKNTIKIRNNNNWITKEYIQKMKQRDKLYVRWKKIQNEITEREFKHEKNELNKLRIKLQKIHAETRFIETQGDSRKTWKIINDLCSKNSKKNKEIHKIIDQDGNLCENDQKIAEKMNQHFASIGHTLASKIKQTPGIKYKEEEVEQSITLKKTDLTEVKEIIKDLKNHSAPGIDGITKKDIEILIDIIGNKLVQLINIVLENGCFPEELKLSKIIPIYKKGEHDNLNNYRPISLLSIFSKLLEKVIKERLVNFIDTTFKFDKSQYGFQKRSGTLGATVDLLEYIISELNENRYVVTVFIDLQKAFDTVDIVLLLEKLQNMGFRGKCHELLNSYSTRRRQQTYVNGVTSDEASVEVGIAQGSVLGPLQYLLHVQSLKYAGLRVKYYKYCDDTVLIFSGVNKIELEQDINSDLERYYQWLCYNKLTINVEKTVYMVLHQVGKNQIDPIIKINDCVLKKVKQYKYLGLTVTDNVTWNVHIDSILQKVAPMLGAIRRCNHMLSKNARHLLYNSFIEPHIRYLIPCYGNASVEAINKLQRLQNKAIKTIFAKNYNTPSDTLYKDYPFLKLENLKNFEQTKLIYKIQNNLIKTNVQLKHNKDYHNYNLRTKERLRNNFARTKKGQDSPIYQSICTYNSIPKTVLEGCEKVVYYNLKKFLKEQRQ